MDQLQSTCTGAQCRSHWRISQKTTQFGQPITGGLENDFCCGFTRFSQREWMGGGGKCQTNMLERKGEGKERKRQISYKGSRGGRDNQSEILVQNCLHCLPTDFHIVQSVWPWRQLGQIIGNKSNLQWCITQLAATVRCTVQRTALHTALCSQCPAVELGCCRPRTQKLH
jgi:hypothetical protein